LILKFQDFSEKYQIKSERVKEFMADKILRLKYYEKKNKFLSNKERVNKKLLDATGPFREGVDVEKVGEESNNPPF
jgi:hypothetical protein